MLRSSRYGQRAIVISCLALLVILLCFATAARAAEPVKVGKSIARTGPLADTGKAALLGTQIWVEDINAKGGILGRPTQLIYYDDQSNPLSNPSLSCAPGALSNLVPAKIVEILGNPPVLITESRQACDQLMTQLVLEWTPRNISALGHIGLAFAHPLVEQVLIQIRAQADLNRAWVGKHHVRHCTTSADSFEAFELKAEGAQPMHSVTSRLAAGRDPSVCAHPILFTATMFF